MSEVKAALAAGDPTAGRRRRSSAVTLIPAEETATQGNSHIGFGGRLAGMWERLGKVWRGSVAGREGNGKHDTTETPIGNTPDASFQGSEREQNAGSPAFIASTTRPRGSSISLRAPVTGGPPGVSSPFAAGISAGGGRGPATPRGVSLTGPSASAAPPLRKASLDRKAVTEPRRASLEGPGSGGNSDGLGRLELVREQNPRYSSRAGLRGLPPSSLSTQPAIVVDAGAANTAGEPGPASPLRSGVTHRRGRSDGLAAGSFKRGQPATAGAPDPRIPMEDFELRAGGNFAVFLALRWVGNLGGSTTSESGFEMLVRLALREARHSALGGFTHRRPRADQPAGRRGPDNDLGQGTAGRDGNRNSSIHFWDLPATGRSNSSFTSKGVSGEVGSGSAPLSAAVARGHHISALVTGVLRENFMPQVGTWLRARGSAGWFSGKGGYFVVVVCGASTEIC